MQKYDCEALLSEFVYDTDVRKPPDGFRRERFRTGWEDVTIREKVYAEKTLKRLTWQNLGYRMGMLFGEKTPDEVYSAYGQFTKNHGFAKTDSAEDVIRFLISDKEKRKNYLLILLEVIKRADSYGKQKWGVHCIKNKIKLLVGNIIVFTIEKECVWLALDKSLADSSENTLSLLENYGSWKWDEKDYPIYKQVPSRNGYYLSSDSGAWSEIKELHLEFVIKVAKKYKHLNKKSQICHSSELLSYIRNELNQSVPEPFYEENSDGSFFPEEVRDNEEYYEGATKKITVNIYERNPEARQKCIELYGTDCYICGFNFEKQYGETGKGFIHVHHLKPLSEIGEKYELDPVQDLRPVCPNCHAMLHKKKPPYSIGELKQIIST